MMESEPECKALKIDHEENDTAKKSKQHLLSFSNFKVDSVINDNLQRKVLAVTGRFATNPDPAVILLEKQTFTKESHNVLFSNASILTSVHSNDIYSTYVMHPPPEVNGIKATLIYPATPKHIEKYTSQELHVITETAQDYENITLPFLEECQFSLQWVYNILEKKAEVERVFYEDTDDEIGFMMVPDMKWDLQDATSLYVTAIVHKRGLKSMRDLRGHHLPLLRNIMRKGLESIKDKYGVEESKLRVYFHYQPSYYHLHVHFTHIHLEAAGTDMDRGRLLSDVITNLSISSDYYVHAPLTFTLKANDRLLVRFRKASALS